MGTPHFGCCGWERVVEAKLRRNQQAEIWLPAEKEHYRFNVYVESVDGVALFLLERPIHG